MIGIYKITNLKNDKVYIGQSIDVEKRFIRHRNTAFNKNSPEYVYPLYQAIRKYGLDSFKFEVVEICSKKELNDKEIFYIQKYNSTNRNFGYNQVDGGNVAKYGKLSQTQVDEIKQLLSSSKLLIKDIAKKFNVHENTIININTGKTWTEENEIYPIRTLEKTITTCNICGATITNGAKHCTKCSHLLQRKVPRPPKDELLNKVQALGLEGTGRLFGVSGNTIKKWILSD